MQQPEILMPNDPGMEASLLSSMFNDRESVLEASKTLRPEHFYNKKHELVFRACLHLARNSHPIEMRTIVETLLAKKKLDDIGGPTGGLMFLDALYNEPPAGDITYYAEKVRELAVKRSLIEQANALIKRASNGEPAIDTIRYIQDELQKLTAPSVEYDRRSGVHISNVFTADRMIEEYRNYLANLKNNRFLTGIDEIDKRIRGVGGGEVMTIIARAGSFKTALLQNLLLNYTKNSAWGAVFFSLEMPVANVTERFFSILSGSPAREVEDQFKDSCPEDWVQNFQRDMRKLFVVPTKIGLEDIPQYVALIEQQLRVKIGVVGIDYMGLMDAQGDGEYEQVSRIARGLKGIAKTINLPVIVLSQVSRKGGDGDVEVSLDMGRGSGAIEEGADFVLGLWQQEKTCGYGEATFELIARILKNRKGPKGSRWVLQLDPKALKFGSKTTEYTPPKKSRKSTDRC